MSNSKFINIVQFQTTFKITDHSLNLLTIHEKTFEYRIILSNILITRIYRLKYKLSISINCYCIGTGRTGRYAEIKDEN